MTDGHISWLSACSGGSLWWWWPPPPVCGRGVKPLCLTSMRGAVWGSGSRNVMAGARGSRGGLVVVGEREMLGEEGGEVGVGGKGSRTCSAVEEAASWGWHWWQSGLGSRGICRGRERWGREETGQFAGEVSHRPSLSPGRSHPVRGSRRGLACSAGDLPGRGRCRRCRAGDWPAGWLGGNGGESFWPFYWLGLLASTGHCIIARLEIGRLSVSPA